MEQDFFSMKIDPEDKRKLLAMAKRTARTASGMVRFLINREWETTYKLTETGQQVLEEARESSTTE